MGRQYNKIFKAYKKNLKKLSKKAVHDPALYMDYIILYLCYLRDNYIINCGPFWAPDNVEKERNIGLEALIIAIAEYKFYITCIFKYYKIENNCIVKALDLPESTVQNLYVKEKAHHWHTFWQLVELNMETWLTDATIRF